MIEYNVNAYETFKDDKNLKKKLNVIFNMKWIEYNAIHNIIL